MKNVILISGAMGVGKTAVSKKLLELLPDSVFLDGDWCWMADPFQVTEETKRMVTGNICYMLNSFIHCSAYKNIIFCWVMHEQWIIDGIVARLDLAECALHSISLVCSDDALRARLQRDVELGVRKEDVITRSIARLPMYDALDTVKLDVSSLTADEAAHIIMEEML